MINGKIIQDINAETELKRLSDAIGQTGGDSLRQLSTMPTASATYVDKIVQYVGTTNANYTQAYFYKCVGTNTIDATATLTISGTAGIGTVVCDVDEFGAQVGYNADTYKLEYKPYPESITVIDAHDVSRTLMRDRSEDENNRYAWLTSDNTSLWTTVQAPELGTEFYTSSSENGTAFVSYDNVTVNSYSDTYGRWQQDLGDDYFDDTDIADWGISYNGVALVGVKIQVVYTPESTSSNTTYSWTRINVQPTE